MADPGKIVTTPIWLTCCQSQVEAIFGGGLGPKLVASLRWLDWPETVIDWRPMTS